MALPFGAHSAFGALAKPSPLSFGFGLGVPQHHLPPPPEPTLPTEFEPYLVRQFQPQQPHASGSGSAPASGSSTPLSSRKRRQEFDNDTEGDAAMDGRSPSPAATPDRPMRRLGGKKMRMIAAAGARAADGKPVLEEDDSVDLGSILAGLPPSSHLALLLSLIHDRPDLKPYILERIPRPTLDTAVQAIISGAKKLRDAYPYSVPAPAATSSSSTTPSLGFGFGSQPPTASSSAHASSGNAAMRDSYIRTRLRQPVRDFTKVLLSYMAYFSAAPPSSTATPTTASSSSSSTPPQQPESKRPAAIPLHPGDTFTFLNTATLHVLRFPALTLAEFTRPAENVVMPRLQAEWQAWVQKVDEEVNKYGGMYRDEVVKGWERGLDELVALEEQVQASLLASSSSSAKVPQVPLIGMRAIRDRWVQQAGWLIGRRAASIGMEM